MNYELGCLREGVYPYIYTPVGETSSVRSNRLDVGLGLILDVSVGILQKTVEACGERWPPGHGPSRLALYFHDWASALFWCLLAPS
jgi:hypothetical protein